MTNFDELFEKYNPVTGAVPTVPPTVALVQSLIEQVSALDVDSFDDICYKADVLEILKKAL